MEGKSNQLLGGITIVLMVYFSTPFVLQLSLVGILDSVGAALIVVAGCHLVFLISGWLAISLTAVFLTLVISFNVVSGQYFQYQQYYPTVESFYLIKELWSLLSAYRSWQLFLALVSVIVGVMLLHMVTFYARPSSTRTNVSAAILFLAASVSIQWGYAEVNHNSRFSVTDSSPISHFIRSTGVFPFVSEDAETAARYERDAVVRNLLESPEKELPDKYSVESIGKLLGYGSGYGDRIENSRYPFYKRPVSTGFLSQEPYNVIVLVLESVRASEMGVYGASQSATPFLDSLASKAAYVKNFYATSNYTVKSEHAIHCSALDRMIGRPIADSSGQLKTLCMPELLATQGYTSLWFHGNEKSFYSRDTYLPKLGFDKIYDAEVLNKDGSLQKLGWGVSDTDMLAYAADVLVSVDRPFYAELLTVSNHLPFDYEWGIEFPDYLTKDDTFHARYRRGIYYTDQAVEQFYNAMQQNGVLDRTILVITGDHGIWSFADDTLPDLHKNEQMFRVPMIVISPNKESIVIEGKHSHLDIAPTIVDLLDLRFANDFMGQSIFSTNPAKKGRVIYSMLDNAVSYRYENRTCIPSIQCANSLACTSIHEENIPSTICYDIPKNRDILFDGEPIELSRTTASWEDRALFDYSQISVELGSFPSEYCPIVYNIK